MSVKLLPVHGFVLAGGKSSRMGVDKATLEFCGRPLVEIAVAKLKGFCADVSIVGSREDLAKFAPVVRDERVDAGPGAGVEAGLRAARQEWAMFVPVDVPLVPGELLRRWAVEAIEGHTPRYGASFLLGRNERQPTFCLLKKTALPSVEAALNRGERRLHEILLQGGGPGTRPLWMVDAARFVSGTMPTARKMDRWFSNLNTTTDFEAAESWAKEAE